jgi:hypothetical protein
MSLGGGEKSMSNSAMVDQRGRLKIPVTLLPAVKGSGTESSTPQRGRKTVSQSVFAH